LITRVLKEERKYLNTLNGVNVTDIRILPEVISLYMYRLCKSRGRKWLSWVTEDKFGDKFGFSREFKAEN